MLTADQVRTRKRGSQLQLITLPYFCPSDVIVSLIQHYAY